MAAIIDAYGRTFGTLRVSLTNTCNLGCVYCVDESAAGQVDTLPVQANQKPLSVSQLVDLIGQLHQVLNLQAVRLTGGEPTLYRELIPLTDAISHLSIPAIKMTTNGYLLSHKIEALAEAGLSSLNISLDALDPEVFFQISRRRNLHKILEGIEKALKLGVQVKINTVVMKGLNDNQVLDLLYYARERNIAIRFLEVMQMGHLYGNFSAYFFPESAILATIVRQFDFTPLTREPSATAKYYRMPDGYEFGVISNESDPFCNDCNRLRLDAYGNIFGCLSSNTPISVANYLDNPEGLQQRLRQALSQKKLRFTGSRLSMMTIGG